MGFKETLHKIVHHDEFDHRPTLDELADSQPVGGFMDEGVQYEPRTHALQEAHDTIQKLDPNRVPADFMPYAHTRHRLIDWREHAEEENAKHQTELDDGPEWC